MRHTTSFVFLFSYLSGRQVPRNIQSLLSSIHRCSCWKWVRSRLRKPNFFGLKMCHWSNHHCNLFSTFQSMHCEWRAVRSKRHYRGNSPCFRCPRPHTVQQPCAHSVRPSTRNACCLLPKVWHEPRMVTKVRIHVCNCFYQMLFCFQIHTNMDSLLRSDLLVISGAYKTTIGILTELLRSSPA